MLSAIYQSIFKMNYRIEIAQSKYISELPAISMAAAELFPVEDLPLELRSETIPIKMFEQATSQQRLWIAVDEINDKAVGFAFLTEECGQIHLKELDVHPEHARKGIGSKLLSEVIIWAKNQKYKELTLTTFVHLPWNARFYEKFDFKVIEPSDLSACLTEILDEEAKGLDILKRVLMSLNLNP